MTATLRATANDLLNRVAVELGLDPAVNPFSSTDKSFIQMRYLLNVAGEELADLHDWNFLIKEHSITTVVPGDTGDYALPSDYLRMINQTHWERVNQNQLVGPVTPQEWQYMTASDVSSSVNVSFRLRDGEFSIFPQPPEDALQIYFEYVSRNWVIDADDPAVFKTECTAGGDIPLYDRTLLSRMVKVKYLEAKNFDTTKAQADLDQAFSNLTTSDKGAPILSACASQRRVLLNDANIGNLG